MAASGGHWVKGSFTPAWKAEHRLATWDLDESAVVDGEYVVWHGITANRADIVGAIEKEGLKTPESMGRSARWYMVSTTRAGAEFFAKTGGKVVEMRLPMDRVTSYLWPGADWGSGKQHALQQGHIPAKYVKTVHDVTSWEPGEF